MLFSNLVPIVGVWEMCKPMKHIFSSHDHSTAFCRHLPTLHGVFCDVIMFSHGVGSIFLVEAVVSLWFHLRSIWMNRSRGSCTKDNECILEQRDLLTRVIPTSVFPLTVKFRAHFNVRHVTFVLCCDRWTMF